jgi:Plasmid pRiA4b ORF-3-like protein.
VSLVKTAEAGGHLDRSEQPVGTAVDVMQVNVSLRGLRPPIWRRLEVPARITLAGLHAVLQTAFGWTDSHRTASR